MSLYNEVRPDRVSNIIGQETAKKQIAGTLKSRKIPQAMIFVGVRGTGKTTMARIVAKAVNCEHPDNGEPCNECASCKAIAAGSSLDVVELDAASNNGVDDVHGIIESAAYAPVGKYKVFILDEVHMFSQGAWNALLKTLEEPPKNVIFILCTTEEHKIPATIVSRCRKFYFEKIDLSLIEQYLRTVCDKYGKCYDEDALRLIARSSDGSMRDALSILEAFFDTDNIITDNVAKALGLSGSDAVFAILDAVVRGNATDAISAFHAIERKGASLKELVKSLIEGVTDAMYLIEGADINSILNTESYKEAVCAFSKKISVERCLELTEKLSNVYGNISKSSDASFLVEAALIRSIQYTSEIEALRLRVDALERNGVKVSDLKPKEAEIPVNPPEEVEEAVAPELPDVDGFTDAVEGVFEEPAESTPFDTSAVPFEEEPVPVLSDTGILGNGGSTEETKEGAKIIKMPVPVKVSAEKPEDDVLSHLPEGTKVMGTVSLFDEDTDGEDSPANDTENTAGETLEEPSGADDMSDLPPLDDLSGWL